MTDPSTTEALAGKLRRIASQVEEAGSLIEKLRRERYRKWNQQEAIVDVAGTQFPDTVGSRADC